ncbi:MAG: type II toxin-antitoxin system RelE/ParE family toxin [Ferruginibacter sp.]
MARQIIWSLRAQKDKGEIFKYWSQRNKSNRYSKKLNQLFKEAVQLLREYPYIGRSTDDDSVRIKIVKEYLLIYEFTETSINILSIWDGRQDPSKLDNILK